MKRDAGYWIGRLQLRPHPEGGYFRETYRAEGRIKAECSVPPYPSDRAFSTAIYFLLKGHEVSKFHRLRSDEMWHYDAGSSLTLFSIDPEGQLGEFLLGPDPEEREQFHVIVRSGTWFGAVVNDPASYGLVGCTVAPGFEFEDFEMADRETLVSMYPQHREIILRLT